MSIFRRKKQTDAETESLKSFLDMIAPSIVKFETGYYICGNTFRCAAHSRSWTCSVHRHGARNHRRSHRIYQPENRADTHWKRP